MSDYYSILQIPRNADEAAIKAAYRKLAKRYHPDVNPSAQAKTRFQEINEAYETLGDPKKRATYDSPDKARAQAAAPKQPPKAAPVRPVTMDDMRGVFEGFFGFEPKTGASIKKPKSPDKNPLDTSGLFDAFMKRRS